MGILNVTPDSFSDGGRFYDPADAAEQAKRMAVEGADIIDVGAESTRPGSDRVPPAEQIARLCEVMPAAAETGAIVSIDTTNAEVAAFALDAGAAIINDVSAARDDPKMLLGEPRSMQNRPRYSNVLKEVRDFLASRLAVAVAAGVCRQRVILDPGIGFGKLLEHNLALLGGIGRLVELGCPVLVGPSRKRFIGELSGQGAPERRIAGTIAACLAARRQGATIFRVHDVGPLVEALIVAEAIEKSREDENSAP